MVLSIYLIDTDGSLSRKATLAEPSYVRHNTVV